MRKLPYRLKNISIRKMPGFSSGMETLDDFAEHVNIITGPNASGKSSMARAIQHLIWQNDTQGISIHGAVGIENDHWEIDIDSGRNRNEKNGYEEQLKGLPALEGHHRYLLALHNFVEGNENDLAKEIVKQSIGGFDLEAVQNTLKYNNKVSNKKTTEYKNYEEVEKKYREIRESQKALKQAEENLSGLKSDKEKAEQAVRLNEFYIKVAGYLELKLEKEQLANQLARFPNTIKNVKGQEYEQIKDLETQIEECEVKIEGARKDKEKCENELKQLQIPKSGVEVNIINEIEKRLEDLSKAQREIADLKSRILSEEVNEKKALNSIDSSIHPETWKGIDISDVSGLDEMLHNAHQIAGERQFVISEIKYLEVETVKFQKKNQSVEQLGNGIKILGEWLKEPIKTRAISTKSIWIVSIVGFIGIITTYFFGGWGVFMGALMLLASFFYLVYMKSARRSSSDVLNIREKDFEKSGLTSPMNWNVSSVANRIEELIGNLSDYKAAERISQKLEEAKNRLKQLEKRMDELHSERQKWIDKLQSAPGFPTDNDNAFSSLYWFLNYVIKWQEAHTQRVIHEMKIAEVNQSFSDELDKVNVLFSQFNLRKAEDLISAKSTFEQLKREANIYQNQIQILAQKEEVIQDQEHLKQKNKAKLLEIYKTIGIEEKDKNHVRELILQLEEFNTISQKYHVANQSFLRQESLLKAYSLFEEREEEIRTMTIDEARSKITQNEALANQLERINQEITKIETLIQTKMKGHELEDVLTEKEECLEAISQLYKDNLAVMTGDLIIRELKKETQNKNRPEVFKQANTIFNRITLGRYELKLNEKEGSRFEAYDTVLKRSYGLSELSTGTRVQLLLSVRLAYVETVESSIKLPLLVDELLANSDDERAQAIIEALIEISRQGRQVFYFTAQADEVGKWQAYLQQAELEYKIIRLSSKGNETLNSGDFLSEAYPFSLSQEVPNPEGKNHREFGQLISLQQFNVLTQNSSELPLWYLIEDVHLLSDFLRKGIRNWGQLKSYVKNNGRILNFDEAKFNQFSRLIDVLNRFQELYRTGRSLPINRTVLQNSGAISEAFINKVSEKLEEFKGDPKLLLHALRNKGVPKFRTDSADDLEQYLLDEQFIDDKAPLENEEIRIQIQAWVSNLASNGAEIQITEVENLLNRILERQI